MLIKELIFKYYGSCLVMKEQTDNRMKARTIICVLMLCFLFLPGVAAQTYHKAESFLFSFREENDLLLADCGNNGYELERLSRILRASKDRLLANHYHLLIVSHIGAYDFGDEVVVNEASLRATRIRSYLKTEFNIPAEGVAFYVDCSGLFRNCVHVYLVHKPLPSFANQSIYCSESRYPNAISHVLKKYGEMPYVNLYQRGENGKYNREVYVIHDPLFDRTELEDYRLAIFNNLPSAEPEETEPPVSAVQVAKVAPTKQLVQSRQMVTHEPTEQEPAGVLLAVKTNLIPWFRVTPSLLLTGGEASLRKGSVMPNLEVECYFAERWSVSVAGLYADFSYKGRDENQWAVSGITVTPRIWPLQAGAFQWLHVGVFGQYGDFNVQGEEISAELLYGRTGRYCTGGATVGCLVPLTSGFCIEGEVQAGYRSVFDGKKYRYDTIDKTNYLESRFRSTGFQLGFKLNLVYRFALK